MCGRYALGVRMAYVRERLQQRGMPVDEEPEDDEIRETYNFAPGYNGVVYRADVPDRAHDGDHDHDQEQEAAVDGEEPPTPQPVIREGDIIAQEEGEDPAKTKIRHRLQAMKWGLIPFWTKRQPDYGSMLRTINCRDDSLIEDRGMWTTMKRRKRCVVVCQGFYEWLKKGPGGKEKIPHYIRRKDRDLMYFAGLWDCVRFEGSEDKLYTYTIITTSSNPQLKFIHDRMPVILEPGSDAMKTWLDPARVNWSKELQSLLKPYEGELECYPVPKEVGKVGNNSPDFIIPLQENKKSIANFFANAGKKGKGKTDEETTTSKALAPEEATSDHEKIIIHDKTEERETKDQEWTEDNAPVPVPKEDIETAARRGIKREHPPSDDDEDTPKGFKAQKEDATPSPERKRKASPSPPKKAEAAPARKTRSATRKETSNGNQKTDGSQRITNFFKK
ncbi:hypothetical protein VTN00DRAFT_10094 [Thermoascus crustaceus]|uniref:uncharacterized protein n=1 Tax=Thermoascus crustaceus TaxID=5088 RepID=UPI0037426EB0